LESKKRFFLLVVLFIIQFSAIANAANISEEYLILREKEIYKFSLDLFETGEYYRAITEAKRYISVFPEGGRADDLQKLIGDSYLMAREWKQAIDSYQEFMLKFPSSQHAPSVLFNMAIAQIKIKEYSEAEELFEKIIATGSSEQKYKSVLWKVLILIHQSRFEEVERMLDDGFIKENISKELGIIEKTIDVKKNANYKSPKLAGFMSALLPGSGQVYNERYKDAASSFILNGLFIGGAYIAFDNDNFPLGAILTIFSVGWYKGNIYGAVNGAHKYNRKIEEDIFKKSIENFGLYEEEVRNMPSMKIIFKFYF
jgi:tetratricopeptide (TPR) repeat protein